MSHMPKVGKYLSAPRPLFCLLFAAMIVSLCLKTTAIAQSNGNTLISATASSSVGNGDSGWPQISANGKVIVFASGASDLVIGDTNAVADIFVANRTTGAIRLVSRAPDGTAANGYSSFPRVSADGRYVVFVSYATNLVAGTLTAVGHCYRLDLKTGTITQADTTFDGAEALGSCGRIDVSSDGSLAVFESGADNLVPGDTNGVMDIFVHDFKRGQTSRVSVEQNGTQLSGVSQEPRISGDKHYVVFVSDVDDSSIILNRILSKSLITGALQNLSGGLIGSDQVSSSWPSISDDGRFILFQPQPSGFIPGDPDSLIGCFLFDRKNSTYSRVTYDPDGSMLDDLSLPELCEISGSGGTVVYSYFVNAGLGDPDYGTRVRVFNRATNKTTELKAADGGTPTQGSLATYVSTSRDGRWVVYDSNATNIISDDTNAANDVFLTEYDSELFADAVPALATAKINGRRVTLDFQHFKDAVYHITLRRRGPGGRTRTYTRTKNQLGISSLSPGRWYVKYVVTSESTGNTVTSQSSPVRQFVVR